MHPVRSPSLNINQLQSMNYNCLNVSVPFSPVIHSEAVRQSVPFIIVSSMEFTKTSPIRTKALEAMESPTSTLKIIKIPVGYNLKVYNNFLVLNLFIHTYMIAVWNRQPCWTEAKYLFIFTPSRGKLMFISFSSNGLILAQLRISSVGLYTTTEWPKTAFEKES